MTTYAGWGRVLQKIRSSIDEGQRITEGFGRLEFGSSDILNDEPGYYTALFNVSDPVQHRRIMGIGRVNLSAKTVDLRKRPWSSGSGWTGQSSDRTQPHRPRLPVPTWPSRTGAGSR